MQAEAVRVINIDLTEFVRGNDVKCKDGEEFGHKEKPWMCCNAKEILILKQNSKTWLHA